MSLFETPSRQFDGLDVQMMEQRASRQVLILPTRPNRPHRRSRSGICWGCQSVWVQVRKVEWWDTHKGVPILDPLIDLMPHNDWYEVDVPAGMTRQVWVYVPIRNCRIVAAGSQSASSPNKRCVRYRGKSIWQSGWLRKSVLSFSQLN